MGLGKVESAAELRLCDPLSHSLTSSHTVPKVHLLAQPSPGKLLVVQ